MVVILMGVAGSGKTEVGRALAAALHWRFVDADACHAPSSLAKLRAGIPLDDDDRAPWLAALHAIIARAIDRREHLALACSALTRRHREVLRGGLKPVRFVHLVADEATLGRRLAARRGHVAGPELLPSQLATLEPPAEALTVDATRPVAEIVEAIRVAHGL